MLRAGRPPSRRRSREKKLLKDLADIERKRGELDLSIERTRKIIARLPADAELDELGREREEFKSVQEAATKALRTAADAHSAALGKHAELEDTIGTEVALIEARGHVRARDQAAAKIEQSQEHRLAAAAAKEAADAAVALTQHQLSQADEALRVAKDEESALLRMHSAHELRGTLAAGEPCPVCEQIVTAVPEDRAPAELGEIATRVKQAVAIQVSASAAERTAAFELEKLKVALETSSASLATSKPSVTAANRSC